MNRFLKFICLFIFFFFFSFSDVHAVENEKVTLYLFHGDGCPHCREEIEFLDTIKNKYDNLEIVKYETWYDEENSELLEDVKEFLDVESGGVPFTVIGDITILGFGSGTGSRIERAIKFYDDNLYVDVVEQVKNGTNEKEVKEENMESTSDKFEKEEKKTDDSLTVNLPIIGKVNLKSVSVMSGAVILGLLDGFNPCAMWILLFLISMLIGINDRKRMWILGLSFLITSAAVYMAIMLSWLNIVVKMTTVIWIRNIIALIAVIGGIFNLRSFYKSHDGGCNVVDDKKRKKIFSKIRKFTSEKNLFLALIGVIGLAISVNFVELACSAGLPLIFTQLLAINGISGMNGFMYTLLYIVFFLFDDMIIFFIAMITLKVTGISTKYSKYSHLIGGILMIIVGLLLLFKPEWLMFSNF